VLGYRFIVMTPRSRQRTAGVPLTLRGGIGMRLGLLALGLFMFACGIVALLESHLGLSPWDVFHQGLARHSPLSFGEANIVVGVGALTVAALLGARLGVGTVGNAVLVGSFVALLTPLHGIAALAGQPLPIRIPLLVAGLALMAAGTAVYLGANLGAGPRDSLMVVGARRSGLRIGIVRSGLELAALGAGVALGGTVGIGTVAFALGIGPAVEIWCWLLAQSPLAARLPAPAPRPTPVSPAAPCSGDDRASRLCREAWGKG
jgi:uncharacterized membrane protein YczE